MSGRYRPDIQGLRALAVLLVVFFHAGLPVPGGFTGVDVFFVISGFVIGGLLLGELEQSGTLNLGRFYARRIKRLLPALAVVLAFAAIVGVFLAPIATQPIEARTAFYASGFAANFYLYSVPAGYFDPAATANPLLHTWTLAVEEQFYVLFPALLLLCWWAGTRSSRFLSRTIALAVLAIVTGGSFLLSLALSRGHDLFGVPSPGSFAFYSSPTRAWEFGVGALVALCVPWLKRIGSTVAAVLGAAGLALIVIGAFVIHQAGFPGLHAVVPVAGAAALLAAGTATVSGVPRLISTRPAVWIGDLAYSWYLWHWPFIVFAIAQWPGQGWVAPAAAVASLAPAWAVYHCVEDPIRRSPRTDLRRLSVIAVVCVAVPVSAAFALMYSHELLAASSPGAEWTRSQRQHADALRGCDSLIPLGQRRNPKCIWHVPHARGAVVLVGDSNAGQFTEPVTLAANQVGYDAIVVTSSGCPFVSVPVDGLMASSSDCLRFVTRTLDDLVQMKPSLVILAARSDSIVEGAARIGNPAMRHGTQSPEEKARLWQRGLEYVLRQLNGAGVPTIVVHPVPAIPNLPAYCSTAAIFNGSCIGSITRTASDARQRRTIAAENRAVASTTQSSSLNFEDALCSKTLCSDLRHGMRLYRNSDHLSVAGALTLTPLFKEAIALHAVRRS
jgi:peptidoglycan/LPS O-acetylase OafA/YrhL